MVWFDFFILGVVLGGGFGFNNGVTAQCLYNLSNADDLPPDKFVAALTDPCRYDKYARPDFPDLLNTTISMIITHLEAVQSQFTAYLTVTFEYEDKRLAYDKISPQRGILLGDESLKEKIWTPNLIMKSKAETTVLGIENKDMFVSVDNTGLVKYSYQMVAKFDCLMKLQKFPFDNQKCTLAFTDWTYISTDLKIQWSDTENNASHLNFGEYVIDNVQTESDETSGPNQLFFSDVNFSEVSMIIEYHRDIGYYLLDFFIPSYLLVFTAWVTFWLQADAGPPRATLGASTIVAFITLHLGVTKDLPKVSYTKASDVWFLGVTCFIFLSLAEFAFVNVIWRRKKQVELKKPKSKYIIKSAVMPKKAREDLKRYESTQTLAIVSQSNDSLDNIKPSSFENYKSVDSLESMSNGHSVISIPEDTSREFTWTTMTPQEVAIYVDRKARIVFPVAFLIFNVLYWVFVYRL